MTITHAEYGDSWPFTVESGVLRGEPTGQTLSDGTTLAEVTFTAGGRTYYVNGTAKGTHRYSQLKEIWAADSDGPKQLALKKNMGPIIGRGLKLARGVDEPFVKPSPTLTAASERGGPIRCDQFEVSAAFEAGSAGNGKRMRVSLKTDLPDSTNLMVSMGRSFRNSANNEEYSIYYVEEKSTVGAWRAGKVVALDQVRWQAKLDEKRATFRRIGEQLNVTGVDRAVAVEFVVPVNQTDSRFGLRNANLSGAAVKESNGLRTVRGESKLEWPVLIQ